MTRPVVDPADYRFLQPDVPEGAYGRTWPVRTSDVTPQRRLRLDGVARYLQDMANDELFATGFDRSDPYWLVRRTIIDVLAPIHWPADVTLHRWCESMSTRWCNMRIAVRGSDGGHIETEGFWIRFNANTGMPTHMSDTGMEYLARTSGESRLKWKSLHTEPAPEASAGDREFDLRATDFDPFEHLNNAAYWEIVEDGMDGSAIFDGPHRAIIEYLAPLPMGARVTVRSRRDGDRQLLWLFRLDDEGRPAEKPAATMSVRALPGTPFAEPAPWPVPMGAE